MSKKLDVKETKIEVKDDQIMMSFVAKLPKILTDCFDLNQIEDAVFDSDGLYIFFSLKPKEKK